MQNLIKTVPVLVVSLLAFLPSVSVYAISIASDQFVYTATEEAPDLDTQGTEGDGWAGAWTDTVAGGVAKFKLGRKSLKTLGARALPTVGGSIVGDGSARALREFSSVYGDDLNYQTYYMSFMFNDESNLDYEYKAFELHDNSVQVGSSDGSRVFQLGALAGDGTDGHEIQAKVASGKVVSLGPRSPGPELYLIEFKMAPTVGARGGPDIISIWRNPSAILDAADATIIVVGSAFRFNQIAFADFNSESGTTTFDNFQFGDSLDSVMAVLIP